MKISISEKYVELECSNQAVLAEIRVMVGMGGEQTSDSLLLSRPQIPILIEKLVGIPSFVALKNYLAMSLALMDADAKHQIFHTVRGGEEYFLGSNEAVHLKRYLSARSGGTQR